MMTRLMRWSRRSPARRLVLIAGLVVIPGGAGLAIGRLGGFTAVLLAAAAAALFTVWIASTPLPADIRLVPPRPASGDPRQPIPCALCGYRCGGGFWTPVPFAPGGHVMHTMGCGPTLPGEEPLTDPTYRRTVDGRYVPIDR